MSLLAPLRRRRALRGGRPARAGVLRSVRLFRLFLGEQGDPDAFYSHLALDAVEQVAAVCGDVCGDVRGGVCGDLCGGLAGRTVVDVGGGGGWFTAAFRALGAHCYLFEPDAGELRAGALAGAVLADGYRLPVRDGGADVVFSSNVLEHVPDPMGLIEEMIRVTRPGGLIYLSYCNWYSPWGGHEMSPWHYLGAGYARRRYIRRFAGQPKHECGVNLFPVHIGPVLRALRARPDVSIIEARPRYYPWWCGWLVRVPVVREVATWNLMLIMRRAG